MHAEDVGAVVKTGVVPKLQSTAARLAARGPVGPRVEAWAGLCMWERRSYRRLYKLLKVLDNSWRLQIFIIF